ncbi:hypothetical protein [Cumulibacter manganitolerans]|uniref:hypothetical protein n=1 Tax=Cumulibacter manganitolerans TaxID=1884992 RepID=UPI001E40D992|nr:hypothetical protein [Cumulibacter manganitolerans]
MSGSSESDTTAQPPRGSHAPIQRRRDRYPTIRKEPSDWRVAPNLTPETYDAFSWDAARSWLDGLPTGGLNIAHEAVDRIGTPPARTPSGWPCAGWDGAVIGPS